MHFKVVYKKEIHMLTVKNMSTFSELESSIRTIFKNLPNKFTITYLDSDGDRIYLINDADLKILL
jgi:hypothetical protein